LSKDCGHVAADAKREERSCYRSDADIAVCSTRCQTGVGVNNGVDGVESCREGVDDQPNIIKRGR